MSIDKILRRQKLVISSFKTSNQEAKSVNEPDINEKLFNKSNFNFLHFSQQNNDSFIKCYKNYDMGAFVSNKLMGSQNLRTVSSEFQRKLFFPSQNLFSGKNFMKGLTLKEVQFESSGIKIRNNEMDLKFKKNIKVVSKSSIFSQAKPENPEKFNKTSNQKPYIHKSQTTYISKNKVLFIPKIQTKIHQSKQSKTLEEKTNSPHKESSLNIVHSNEMNNKINESQLDLKEKSEESTHSKELENDNVNDNLSSSEYEILKWPSLIFGQRKICQRGLSASKEALFKRNSFGKNVYKQKIEGFISHIQMDKNPGFNMKEIASFPESLSYEEIEEVKFEFRTKPALRKYENLDNILQKLKFFKRFTKIARINILLQSSLIEYNANERIFSEGDYGDLMYIIIKGSVDIRLRRKGKYKAEEPVDVVINSFYDGDHFGDLAMMSIKKSDASNNKASKRIQLNELTIQDVRAYLKKFYESKNSGYENYMDSKAFDEEKHLRNSFLGIKNKSYFGIEENDQNIERTKRTATVQTCERTVFLVLKREKYQQIFFSILQQSLEEKIQTLLRTPIFENFEPYLLLPFAYYLKEKTYKLGDKIIIQGEQLKNFCIISKGRCEVLFEMKPTSITLKFLKQGDILGGRTIMTMGEIEKQTGNKNIDMESVLKAKLTLRVESPKFEMYYIDKASFELLPLDFKTEIRQKLITVKDFDEYPIDQIRMENMKWQKIKNKKIEIFLKKTKTFNARFLFK